MNQTWQGWSFGKGDSFCTNEADSQFGEAIWRLIARGNLNKSFKKNVFSRTSNSNVTIDDM